MPLKEYQKKRKFSKTPEPKGKSTVSKGGKRFVIQKHHASHLHYDFRLEIDGVLKSWAVPKGPSMNSDNKRLAIMVEDHPLDYYDFEGVIPEGNYGAGTVMVWDWGIFETVKNEKGNSPEEQLKNGHLSFVLNGEKLKGEFALIRIKGKSDNNWLLVKKKDSFESDKDVLKKDKSVKSKRSFEKITKASSDGLLKDQSDKVRKPFPRFIKPMLATLASEAFDDKQWCFEVKWDGYRGIAAIQERKVRLYSRNELLLNEKFPEIIEALQMIKHNAIIDGEIVVTDSEGVSKFQLIQNYQKTKEGNLLYYAFDLMYLDDYDIMKISLKDRKKLLAETLPTSSVIRYSDHFTEKGIAFFEAARQNGLEGIIAKKLDSDYLPGKRSKEWLKIKLVLEQEAVIAGYTEPRKTREHFGSLILGVYEGKRFEYIGNSGGGFKEAELKELIEKLKPFKQNNCPFDEIPDLKTKVTWVEPVIVCEVRFQEWTQDGVMRQPVFLGIREDKNPGEVIKEISSTMKKGEIHAKKSQNKYSARDKKQNIVIEGIKLQLTNLDKVFWPDEGFTKGDVIDYYDKVSDYILQYLKDRPQVLNRTPDGIKSKGFYQKNAKDYPEWVSSVKLYSESEDKNINYLLCQDKASLIYLANLGCVELNPWLSKVESIENPDFCVIDLDPLNIDFDTVVETALVIKEVLDEVKIKAWCKTSGKKGIHILIPLGAKYTYDQSRQFAELIGSMVHEKIPSFTSLERMPSKRNEKVYIDCLQNRYGQTIAAPYSIRPVKGATVSTPLKWPELKKGIHPSDFTIKSVVERFKKEGDLFSGLIKDKGIELDEVLEMIHTTELVIPRYEGSKGY